MERFFKKPLRAGCKWGGVPLLHQLIRRYPADVERYLTLLKKRGVPYKDAEDSVTGEGALHVAIDLGINPLYDRVLLAIISSRADVNKKDKQFETPLIRAVKKGDLNKIKILLWAGAQLDDVCHQGKTAVHWALLGKNGDIIDRLLHEDAKKWVNLGDDNNRTPLHYAVEMGELKYIKQLVAKGAQTTALDKNGHSPMMEMSTADLETENGTDIAEFLMGKNWHLVMNNRDSNKTVIHTENPLKAAKKKEINKQRVPDNLDITVLGQKEMRGIFGRALVAKEHRMLIEAVNEKHEEKALKIWELLLSGEESGSWEELNEPIPSDELKAALRAAYLLESRFGKNIVEGVMRKRSLPSVKRSA